MASEAVIETAIAHNEERLSALPNVVGMGIVDDPGGKGPVAAVYVSKKVAEADLKRAERIPKRLFAQFDQRRRWVPVTVIEQGIVELESFGE